MRNLLSPKLLVLATLLATAACSGGGSNPADASTESGANDSGKGKDVNLPPADGGDDGGTTVSIDPECTVPSGSPSNGSCVTLDDAGVLCNPVTNQACDADAGEACDIDPSGALACFPSPPPNTAAICATCDDQNVACAPGSSCVPVADGGSECARFCCTDADCGSGHCDKTTLQSDPIGFCVK